MARLDPRRFIVNGGSPGDDISSNGSSYDDGPAEDGQGSKGRCAEHRLYVISRAGSGEVHYLLLTPDHCDILSYRIHTEVWKPIQDLMNYGVIAMDNFVYILGGFDRIRARHLSRVLRYDPTESLWIELAPMITPRAKFGLCCQGGRIYVSGGEKNDGRLTASCEVYDPQTDSWSKAGMLPTPRANHVCISYSSEIFCAGGYYGSNSHSNMWVYEEHKWGELDEDYPHRLPCLLDRFAIAAVDNTFYFVGGVASKVSTRKEKATFLTQRKVFSYTTGISAMKEDTAKEDLISPWNFKLPQMIHARHSAGAIALGKKVYVLGGTDLETGNQVTLAEFLNTETGEWEEDFRFRKGDVSNVACCILEVPKIPVQERKTTYRLKWVLW